MDLGLEIEQLHRELAELRQYVDSIPRVPATELGATVGEDIPVAGDTIPEIVDQTGELGTTGEWRDDGTVPGLALDEGGADDLASAGYRTLGFVADGGGQRVIFQAPIMVNEDGLGVELGAGLDVIDNALVALHDLLSASHGDTTAAAVQRGDVIIGSGATPKWTRLAKGTEGHVLTMGANEPAWAASSSHYHDGESGWESSGKVYAVYK